MPLQRQISTILDIPIAFAQQMMKLEAELEGVYAENPST